MECVRCGVCGEWAGVITACVFGYLKVTIIRAYKILRFDYPSHFAGTNNCGIKKNTVNYSDFAPIKSHYIICWYI